MNISNSVTVVAILRAEERFIEEWVVYHWLLGVERFILYDNEPTQPLGRVLAPYRGFVDVIAWRPARDPAGPHNIQLQAYRDALSRIRTRWVAFIDGDEFITLRRHAHLSEFLADYVDCGAVLLAWHLFGHNGHYHPPPGLITQALTTKRAAPSTQFKSLNQVEAIAALNSVHSPVLKPGWRTVDVHRHDFNGTLQPIADESANINHYMCRSFETWMQRVDRGNTHFMPENCPPEARWHFDRWECLVKFVAVIMKDWNETRDEYMLRYSDAIRQAIASAKRQPLAATEPQNMPVA